VAPYFNATREDSLLMQDQLSFAYERTDGLSNFGGAMVTIAVARPSSLFTDDFRRCTGTALSPWQVYSPTWYFSSGTMHGNQSAAYAHSYLSPTWTNANYSVEADVQVTAGAYGGGLGSRLNTTNGAHYAAWLYPASGTIKLIKFSDWSTWGYNGAPLTPMTQTNVTISTGWHPLKLVCSNDFLQVYYHGTNVITQQDTDTDTNKPVLLTKGIDLGLYDAIMSVSNLVVSPIP
jgi:hypothetical protein